MGSSSSRRLAPVRRVPTGYVRHRLGTARVLLHEDAVEWARRVLEGGETLHEWAAGHDEGSTFAGRGTVHAVPAPVPGPDRRSRWAVRHYRRGGAVASLLDDRYLRLGRPRPFRELAASATARERGVATPAVMAGAVYPAGIHYRCDLVTEVVPDARTLARVLHDTDGTRGWLDAMVAAGRLVDALGEAGVFHVDLNAHNIVFEDGDPARTWVLDLDRARIRSRPSEGAKERMRARLTRSVVKEGTPTGDPLGDREVLAALRGGAGADGVGSPSAGAEGR